MKKWFHQKVQGARPAPSLNDNQTLQAIAGLREQLRPAAGDFVEA